MDALMTGKGDVWDPSEEVINNVTREVSESLRQVVGLSSSGYPDPTVFLECFDRCLLLNLFILLLVNLTSG